MNLQSLRTKVLFAASVLGSIGSAAAENIPDLFLHQNTSLSGDWQIIVDPYESGFYDYRWTQRDKSNSPSRAEAFYLDAHPTDSSERIEYDFDKSPSLRVPGDWNTQKPELFYYEGSLWYRRKFDFSPREGGGHTFVRFGAANYRADVYLNGKKLGTHAGGFTPFTFDATKQLKTGSNSLVVRVDNKRSKEFVPTLNTDWWNYGGLTRDVTLVYTPEKYIADHRILLESEETKMISGSVEIAGAKEGEMVEIEVTGLGTKHEMKTDAAGKASFRFAAPDVQLWSPDSPKLYQLSIRCGTDIVSEPVGFRTIRTRGREILLNGKPIFLRGICIHEEYPLKGGGRINSPEQGNHLLELAKELNCNFVRLAHYPHNEAMTRLADKLGILVWSEVPVYWTIDWENRETYQNAEQQLTDMIRRDANRASIIIWSIANETPVNNARTQFLRNMALKAREIDGTRLISAAMEVHSKPGNPNVNVVEDPLSEYLDIVSFNQYIGWYNGLPDKCGKITWEISYEKPVFISEFGGDAKQGLHGDKKDRWTEEFQADLYQQTFPMLEKINGLAGFSPWILVDFRSPKRALPGVQDGFNRKGLVSSEGVKKKAFSVLQEYYKHRMEKSEQSR
jgi:beta-glucuronidase